MIVAFCPHSRKPATRLLCRRFRHCCVLFPSDGKKYTLVQIGADGVRLCIIGPREIRIMKKSGWKFVGGRFPRPGGGAPPLQLLTCVGFAKRALGIRAPFVWTPDGLYKQLTSNN